MKQILLSLLAVLLLASCTPRHINQTTSYQPFDGIDVSRHQGKIHWKYVAKEPKVKYVYIKATEGATYVDPQFKRNFKKARKAKLAVGVYHFVVTTSSVFDQFVNLASHAPRKKCTLVPMLDIEQSGIRGRWTARQMRDSLRLFSNLILNYYGRAPIIYTGQNYYNTNLAPDFNHLMLMLARYGSNPPMMKGTGHYTAWQFTDKGRVAGINGAVDLSRLAPNTDVRTLFLRPWEE